MSYQIHSELLLADNILLMTKTLEANPLLSKNEFTPYKQIKAAHILPAVKEAINQANKILEDTVVLLDSDKPLTFENTLHVFIEMEEIIEHVWTPVENLLSLMGTKEIRDASEEARPLIIDFYNKFSMDERVYKLTKKYAQTDEAKKLKGEKARYLDNTMKDFKLSGVMLEGEEKEEYKKLNLESSEISQKFSNNVTDSKFELVITDKKDLSGLPEDAIEAAKRDDKWVFTLDYPSFTPFMKFADNGELRKEFYFQYLNKGTREGKDNRELIKRILDIKQRKAKLLGFKNYSEVSVETKMAESANKVKMFLERLGTEVKPLAKKDYDALVEFQKEIGYENTEKNPNKVFSWDNAYLSEKLRKKKYAQS